MLQNFNLYIAPTYYNVRTQITNKFVMKLANTKTDNKLTPWKFYDRTPNMDSSTNASL